MMDTYTIQYASRDTLFFSYHWNAKWILECTVCTWFFFLDGVYRYHLLAVVWFCCCWCWFHTNRWGGRAGCPCKLAQYDVDNLFVFIRKRFRWKSWMLQTGRANHTHRAHLSSLSSLPSTKEEEKRGKSAAILFVRPSWFRMFCSFLMILCFKHPEYRSQTSIHAILEWEKVLFRCWADEKTHYMLMSRTCLRGKGV